MHAAQKPDKSLSPKRKEKEHMQASVGQQRDDCYCMLVLLLCITIKQVIEQEDMQVR